MLAYPGRGRLGRAVVLCCAAALLLLYASTALLASRHKGPSYDEGEEIAMGYNIWLRHDFRMEAANGDLVKRWVALPYFWTQPGFPEIDSADWRAGHPYALGYEFLFRSGNRPEDLLLQARAMNVLLGVALGALIFGCSWELFGAAGGLISLLLYCFSPHMLAFGGMVSTEISTCLTLLGSAWSLWRLLHRVSWGRLGASLAFLSLAWLAKLSALVLIPAAVILVALKLAGGRPIEWRLGRPRLIESPGRQLAVFADLAILHAAVVWAAVWAAYGFRYSASPAPNDPGVVFRPQPAVDAISPRVLAFLSWCRRVHFLPEGYLHGVQWLLGDNDHRQAFANGHWWLGGWRGFFPYAFWVKTSPAFLLLLLAGAAVWWIRRRRGMAGAAAPSLYAAAPFAVLVGVYGAVAMTQNVDIGHRHLLPIYPALEVLAGSAAGLLAWRGTRLLLAASLGFFAFESLRIYPDYLAYFSPLAGGPDHGYQRLVDSSLDWGMDLPQLRDWIARHNPGGRTPLFLTYFGTDDPDHYKFKYRWFSDGFNWLPHVPAIPEPGYYAISATNFQTVESCSFGPWTPNAETNYQIYRHRMRILLRLSRRPKLRALLPEDFEQDALLRILQGYDQWTFGRLCAWLRHHRPPDAEIGHSILVWKLGEAELKEALLGPPAELVSGPPLRAVLHDLVSH
ncbi:MAG TPA: glycosyltransferase family 39 protein [Opitutaceae bacterium]|nr:glycosyltransferase family 39 protein [Opitutaceae bacterium]